MLSIFHTSLRGMKTRLFKTSLSANVENKRILMKKLLLFLGLLPLALSARANVQVYVQATNGLACINYQCTAGEVVRAFALDVTVDRGQILGITNYFRGTCSATARGYGIFPASFRDNVTVSSGSNATWSVSAYSPLAVPADNPGGTQSGLNSSGVTLELGALWDSTVPAAFPPASGTLCALQISQTANVTVTANLVRGGIVAAPRDVVITPQFTGALVGPAVIKTSLSNGLMTILFQGGELESAPMLGGPWTGTGNTSGTYTETPGVTAAKFFRVYYH